MYSSLRFSSSNSFPSFLSYLVELIYVASLHFLNHHSFAVALTRLPRIWSRQLLLSIVTITDVASRLTRLPKRVTRFRKAGLSGLQKGKWSNKACLNKFLHPMEHQMLYPMLHHPLGPTLQGVSTGANNKRLSNSPSASSSTRQSKASGRFISSIESKQSAPCSAAPMECVQDLLYATCRTEGKEKSHQVSSI